jgi:hypothetical protein
MIMHNLPYNGRTPLLVSPAMTQIARFAAVFAACAALAGAAFADPYRVKDLAIDHTAPTANEATLQGREIAKRDGAQRLIERLTLPEDRARQPLNASDLVRAAGGMITQVQDKRAPVAGGFRYTSMVSYNYDPATVRQYLESRGVPYVDSQAGKALIVPSVGPGIDPLAWSNQWTETVTQGGQSTKVGRSDDTVLTPYVASVEAWTRRPSWMEVQSELTTHDADRAVVAEAYAQGSQIYVRLIDLRTGAADPSGAVVGAFADLPSAKAAAIAEMERAWKAQSMVRTSGSTNIAIVATFRDIGEWVKIRNGLESSRLVSGFAVESISPVGADLQFAFNGRPEQLAADLRSRGIDLRGADNGWIVQVLTSQ